jgi:hypothetical protein
MFVKMKYNKQVYLIRSDRINSFEHLIEIVEDNFAKISNSYAFSYKDEADNSIII